jgi:hypothetical protein
LAFFLSCKPSLRRSAERSGAGQGEESHTAEGGKNFYKLTLFDGLLFVRQCPVWAGLNPIPYTLKKIILCFY